jgi:hypothetical protein
LHTEKLSQTERARSFSSELWSSWSTVARSLWIYGEICHGQLLSATGLFAFGATARLSIALEAAGACRTSGTVMTGVFGAQPDEEGSRRLRLGVEHYTA